MKSSSLRNLVALIVLFLLTAPPVLFSQSFTVIKTINVDVEPFGITVAPDGHTMWVANSGGVPAFGGPPNGNTITIIDVGSLEKEPNKIIVGNFPEDIAFTRNGLHAAVTNSTDGTVSIIDTVSRTVTQTLSIAPLGLAFPFGISFNNDGTKIFVTTGGAFNNAIAALDSRDITNVQLLGTVAVSGFPGRLIFKPSQGLLVPSSPAQVGTAQLFDINPVPDTVTRELQMPTNNAFANDIAVTPDGRFAYISIFAFTGGSGGVWVVDLNSFQTVTIIKTGDPSVFGMGRTPDGRFIFATNFTQNQLVAIDPQSNQVVATVPVGANPNKVAVTLDGKQAFVTNQGDTTVSVISIPTTELFQ